MNLNTKRKELGFLIFSVLAIGVEVGIIANIIFDNFYENNKRLFIISVLLVVFITILILVVLMFKYDKTVYGNKMIFAFDFEQKAFIDIPYSMSSVNARILFNNQSEKIKKKLRLKDFYEENDDFYEFSDELVAQIILSHIIKHRGGYKEKVNREKLKEVLVKYKYIDVESILGGNNALELRLPEGFKIVPTDNKSIRIISKYGFVTFRWTTGYKYRGVGRGNTSGAYYTKLLSTFGSADISKCMEVQINLELEYGFNPLKIFMKNTVEFNNFIDRCRNELDKFDIDSSKERYDAEVFSQLVKYLEGKFKSLNE
ncbi:hypothetical protein COI41_15535 [Bacillus toyonensis]|uniref:hypothetical protein n=1 Tax=Bacillus toyonensis TaxID=155322 RepID=UPI000BFE2768|nr:hypothetical protein [Bacillus toyonensis]PHF53902.1 hypothetical protein COI41_15535 [Bacillus toyonensis]